MSSKDMNLSVNGHSQVPPGFRFHPTEEELLHYYLRKKVASEKIDLDVIRDVDLNKLEPWDIQERCKIGSTPQNDWYFFSHKDKKYPTGTRTNRATAAGFWKATGRDKVIYSSGRRIGMRKTLVFYMGRAPHGQKSDWIMHEYRLDDHHHHDSHNDNNINHDHVQCSQMLGESIQEEGWVVCRVFTKKNYQRSATDHHQSPKISSYRQPHNQMQVQQQQQQQHDHSNNPVLDQILLYMNKNTKQENSNQNTTPSNMMMMHQFINQEMQMHDKFLHLPRLEGSPINYRSTNEDWVALDQLVTSQLNGCGGGDGGSGGHLSDMIYDHYEEHNNDDEGAISLLVLPDHHQLPIMNDFNRSLSSNDQQEMMMMIRSDDQQQQEVVYCNEAVDLWSFSGN